MSSRDSILENIRKNKPDPVTLPDVPSFTTPGLNLLNRFVETAQKNGSTIITNKKDLDQWIKLQHPGTRRILSLVQGYEGNIYPDPDLKPKDLKHIDLAIVNSPLGVAENGAIWLSETDCQWRILPFIAEHLLVFLDRNNLVSNMHDAYAKIRIDQEGFGVFVGGPSKTADIEQALVIGAQGSRSHTIFLW
ncbi:MAG: LUD domain-containing protein [Saprospiraceae bacterium]|nr:LUD domain-containing protein [Saprospiraceae bacterium]